MSSDLEIATTRDFSNRSRRIVLHLVLPEEDLEKMPSFVRENIARILQDPRASNATILHRLADFVAEMDGTLPDMIEPRRSVNGETLHGLIGGRTLDL